MDAHAFDVLSKRLGSTSSRRQSVRTLFGFALLGASRAPHAELVEGAAEQRQKRRRPNPTSRIPQAAASVLPEGSPEVEGEIFDPCPARVPRPGHKPGLNGCGSDFFDVPDSNVFSSKKVSFTAACNKHDECYGTCNSDRDQCDLLLASDMEKACDLAYIKRKKKFRSRSDKRQHRRCLAQADIYWATLKSVGWKAYNDAQEDACICCDEDEHVCGDVCCRGTCCLDFGAPGDPVKGYPGTCCDTIDDMCTTRGACVPCEQNCESGICEDGHCLKCLDYGYLEDNPSTDPSRPCGENWCGEQKLGEEIGTFCYYYPLFCPYEDMCETDDDCLVFGKCLQVAECTHSNSPPHFKMCYYPCTCWWI